MVFIKDGISPTAGCSIHSICYFFRRGQINTWHFIWGCILELNKAENSLFMMCIQPLCYYELNVLRQPKTAGTRPAEIAGVRLISNEKCQSPDTFRIPVHHSCHSSQSLKTILAVYNKTREIAGIPVIRTRPRSCGKQSTGSRKSAYCRYNRSCYPRCRHTNGRPGRSTGIFPDNHA